MLQSGIVQEGAAIVRSSAVISRIDLGLNGVTEMDWLVNVGKKTSRGGAHVDEGERRARRQLAQGLRRFARTAFIESNTPSFGAGLRPRTCASRA